MERSPICPYCESKFEEIHGWIFPVGDPQGHKCDHPWHQKIGYDPSLLKLTESDKLFLQELCISPR